MSKTRKLLEKCRQFGVECDNEALRYLRRHSKLFPLVEMAIEKVHEVLPDARMELTVYHDPVYCEKTLTLYVRHEDFNYAFDKIDELRPEIYSNIEPDEWFFITVK